MEKKVNQSVLRKRGRPAGKNRVPLSQAERRARNAQYERERREDLADNFADLAEAIGVSGTITNSELLATVITHLQHASRVKHSSDVESLTRCNKNLLAQIGRLEQQLAEPDQGCSALPAREDVTTTRPVKRKREDDFYEVPVTAVVPKRSPQENKYSPPSLSPELDISRPEFVEQQYFPGPLPSLGYLPVQDISEFKRLPLTPVHEFGYTAPKQEFQSADPWLPNVAMPTQNFISIPKFSPVSSASDLEQEDFDYSSYHFAGPQIPTPEYQIESTSNVASESIHLMQPSTEQYYHQSPRHHHFGSSSADELFAPRHCIPRSQQPYDSRAPVLPNVSGSLGIIPVPGSSGPPDVNGAVKNPSHGGLLSTEEFVSMYF